MSGTYSVSGSWLTLNIIGGTIGSNTRDWTIVDANTLRNQYGDNWRKESKSGSHKPARSPITWNVNSAAAWTEAAGGIGSGGKNRTRAINVNGVISVPMSKDRNGQTALTVAAGAGRKKWRNSY